MVHARTFIKCHYFEYIRTTYTCPPVHGRSRQRLLAKFRHRTTRRLGGDRPRQNKQTQKFSRCPEDRSMGPKSEIPTQPSWAIKSFRFI